MRKYQRQPRTAMKMSLRNGINITYVLNPFHKIIVDIERRRDAFAQKLDDDKKWQPTAEEFEQFEKDKDNLWKIYMLIKQINGQCL